MSISSPLPASLIALIFSSLCFTTTDAFALFPQFQDNTDSIKDTKTLATFSMAAGPHAIAGEPLGIELHGLKAGQKIKLRAERKFSSSGPIFSAEAQFIADQTGTITLENNAAVDGSYLGIDPAGLFWSMRRTDQINTDWKDPEVRLQAFDERSSIAKLYFTLKLAPADIKIESIAEHSGTKIYLPANTNKPPIVIILAGSEGGDGAGRRFGPKLAARGFAAVSYPYYSPNTPRGQEVKGLPQDYVNIPIDGLENLVNTLKKRTDIDSSRIALFGGSKGAEMSLLAASLLPYFKSVVAIAPSDLVWEGFAMDRMLEADRFSSFSYQGKSLPFTPNAGLELAFASSPPVLAHMYREGRKAHPERAKAARIPVEKFAGALLLIAGGDDQMWPALEMARNIQSSRNNVGLSTELLSFDKAGHLVGGDGYSPNDYNAPFAMGGNAQEDGRAQAIAWPKTIQFLKRSLGN